MIVETPSLIRRGSYPQLPLSLSLLRIRAHEMVQSASIYISSDDVSYRLIGSTRLSHFGGPLLDALPSSTNSILEEGPTFTPMGPDIAQVQDFSSNEESWKLGMQIAVIVNTLTNETEICHLRNVTAISADVLRLDGLIRNRFDTVKASFPAGDSWVFITTPARGKLFTDPIITPGATVYVKIVPRARASMPISEVTPQSLTVRGKGIVPMDTSKPWVRLPFPQNPGFAIGGGLTLGVMYRSVLALGTGSGAMRRGFPHEHAPVDGLLVWRFRETAGDTIVHEASTRVASLEVSNSDLVSWFGSEPAEFDVGVVNAKNGFYSTEQKTRITRFS